VLQLSITVDDAYDELERWIGRTEAQLAHLPAGSDQERALALAIRRMKLGRRRYEMKRARDDLERLPWTSTEHRELAQALDRMDDEHFQELRELREMREVLSGHEADTDDRALAEVRAALARAASSLIQPVAAAGIRVAIAETERALARLNTYEHRRPAG
jgi:DNA repair exonuclease SbcCD nuclease subunit